MLAAGTEKEKICLFYTSVVWWAEQDVEALSIPASIKNISEKSPKDPFRQHLLEYLPNIKLVAQNGWHKTPIS